MSIDCEILELFDRCGPPLLRYASSLGLSPEEAEDVVQDTFLALFHHLHLGRDRRNLQGWLFRVAHNQSLRRRHAARRRSDRDREAVVARRIDPSPDPEAAVVASARRRRLLSVARALPPRDRRCLLLRAEGLTYRDIAAALGMSLGGVAKSLSRSFMRLMHADAG